MNHLRTDTNLHQSTKKVERGPVRQIGDKLIQFLQSKTFLVLVDQVIVSGSNFAISVLVSRACGEELFGIYHMGLIFLYYAVGVQNSLVTTPFTIQQAKLVEAEKSRHAGSTVINQVIIATLTAIVFVGLFAVKWFLMARDNVTSLETSELQALGMLIFAVPMFLFKEYARRYCFARFEMITAIAVDLIASLVIVGIVATAMLGEFLSPATAYLGMAIGSMVASACFFILRKNRFEFWFQNAIRDTLQEWKLGRWVLAEQMLNLSCSFALPWIIYMMMDRLSVGRFTGLCMIVNLANPFLYGMANFLLPKYSESAEHGTRESIRKIYINYTIFSVAVIASFLTFCVTIGPIFVQKILLVQDFEYSTVILWIICLRMVIATGNLTTHPALLALGRAKVSTFASAATLIVMFLGSLILIPSFGLMGAVIAWLMSTVIEVIWRTAGFFLALSAYFREKKQLAKEAMG